jgi:hypothetical protein
MVLGTIPIFSIITYLWKRNPLPRRDIALREKLFLLDYIVLFGEESASGGPCEHLARGTSYLDDAVRRRRSALAEKDIDIPAAPAFVAASPSSSPNRQRPA